MIFRPPAALIRPNPPARPNPAELGNGSIISKIKQLTQNKSIKAHRKHTNKLNKNKTKHTYPTTFQKNSKISLNLLPYPSVDVLGPTFS